MRCSLPYSVHDRGGHIVSHRFIYACWAFKVQVQIVVCAAGDDHPGYGEQQQLRQPREPVMPQTAVVPTASPSSRHRSNGLQKLMTTD